MDIFRSEYHDALDVWPLRGQLRSLDDLADDFAGVEYGRYRLIVFDAKYRFLTDGQSENDNAAEARFYNRVDQIAEHTGAAIVLIHHSSKGSQSDKRVTDVGAGAGAQSRAADCHIVLREHEESDCVVLAAAVRSFKPVEPIALRWNFPLWHPATDVDAGRLKREPTRNKQRQDALDKEGSDAILAALAVGPATESGLRIKLGFGQPRVKRLLSKLLSEGKISIKKIETNGNNCDEYSIQKDTF